MKPGDHVVIHRCTAFLLGINMMCIPKALFAYDETALVVAVTCPIDGTQWCLLLTSGNNHGWLPEHSLDVVDNVDFTYCGNLPVP